MTPYPDTAPAPSGPFWNYLDLVLLVGLVFPSLIGAALVTQLLGAIVPALSHAKVWLSMGLFYVLWFCCLYLVLKIRYYDQPIPSALAWIYPRRGLALCILSGPVLAIVTGLLGTALHTPIIDLPMKKFLQGPGAMVWFGVFSVILGPVTEELAFRGFVMPLFVRSFGRELGILFTAVPFGLLHGAQYGWLWQYVVLVALAGVVFGIARQYTGSTLASAAMHGTYNLTFYVAYVFGGAAV